MAEAGGEKRAYDGSKEGKLEGGEREVWEGSMKWVVVVLGGGGGAVASTSQGG